VSTNRLLAWGPIVLGLLLGLAEQNLPAGQPAGTDRWHADYREAMDQAAARKAMLLIYFRPADGPVGEYFESHVLADPSVRKALADHVCLRLQADAEISVKGRPVRLLSHPAFREMQQRPGVAILDLAHPDAPYYGRVVSALPFGPRRCYSAEQLLAVLSLPPGRSADRWREYWRREQEKHEAARAEAPAAGPESAAQPKHTSQAQRAGQPANSNPRSAKAVEVRWLEDYATGRARAEAAERMLLIYFFDSRKADLCERFERETLGDPEVAAGLQDYVCVRLPVDVRIEKDGKQQALLEHAAFRHMAGSPGVAILDFAHPGASYYAHVVSAFPLTRGLWYSAEQMRVILGLPPGELTQRTLIYAVRVHPEHPASTQGKLDAYLLEEARKHSLYQARIRRQGHHHWEKRFHRINARLPAGLIACEVCAESWPGENLVEAAIDCVQSWRHSSGHWEAVSSYHPLYGYDMRRGTNGIWYATGIFGRGRIERSRLAVNEGSLPEGPPQPEVELGESEFSEGTPASLVGRQMPAETQQQ